MLAVTVTPGAAFITSLIVLAVGFGLGAWTGLKVRRGLDRARNFGHKA